VSLSVVTTAAERGRPVLDGKCRGLPRLDTGYFAGQVTRLCASASHLVKGHKIGHPGQRRTIC
jgi:hypothetical protein